jgi:hypothetical protein
MPIAALIVGLILTRSAKLVGDLRADRDLLIVAALLLGTVLLSLLKHYLFGGAEAIDLGAIGNRLDRRHCCLTPEPGGTRADLDPAR